VTDLFLDRTRAFPKVTHVGVCVFPFILAEKVSETSRSTRSPSFPTDDPTQPGCCLVFC
jgi:hypothetical protein